MISRPVWPRLGLAAELAGYGFWLLADAALTLSIRSFQSVVIGLVVAGIVLLRRRATPGIVPIAIVAIVVSIAFSALAYASGLLPAVLTRGERTFLPFSLTAQLALAVLVIAVLRRCTLRTALVLAGAAAVAIVFSPIAQTRAAGLANALTTLSALGWGGAVAIGLVIREVESRRRAALEDVRASERMELARELHDVVAHYVTGIVVAAQAAAVVARTSPDDVDRALAAIEAAGSDALTAMRRMVGVLRGQDAGGARTPGAELRDVAALVARFDPGGTLVRLTTHPGLEHAVLPAGVAATGYRVVQEALTNVRRHAPEAATVEVDVRIREEALLVTVRNDGVPAAAGKPGGGTGGFGLAGMAERVTALDGTLAAGPAGPGTWTVAARVPLRVTR